MGVLVPGTRREDRGRRRDRVDREGQGGELGRGSRTAQAWRSGHRSVLVLLLSGSEEHSVPAAEGLSQRREVFRVEVSGARSRQRGLLHVPHPDPTVQCSLPRQQRLQPEAAVEAVQAGGRARAASRSDHISGSLGDQICRTREADSHAVSHQSRLLRTRGCAATRPSEQGDGPKKL